MQSKNFARMIFKLAFAVTLVLLAVTITSAAGTWSNGQAADVVLGQGAFNTNASGTTASTMNSPVGVVVDPTTGKLFVSDYGNNRILRFSSANANISGSPPEAVLGQADFVSGLANRGGTVAANTLNTPVGIFVDSAGHLWVGDQTNHRVLRFDNASTKANGANADGVLGQADLTSNTANRGGTAAASTLNLPTGVWMDGAGRLWVADAGNNRVLRFDNAASKSNGANADRVLGRPDFTSSTAATTQNGMANPLGVLVSISGVLFVGDDANNRVLRFDNAAAKAIGANADGVLGQANFTSSAAPNPPTQSSLSSPRYLAFEENGGRLFVPDANNSRVLIFNNAVTKANGANADNVLGQTNFTTGTANTGGISASTLNFPRMAFFDNAANVLWQADRDNNRVLRYTPGRLFLPLIVR